MVASSIIHIIEDGVMECLPDTHRVLDAGDLEINHYCPATATDLACTGTPPANPTPRLTRKRQQPREKAAYPRKRAVQACRTCRLRRTKCDNEHPTCTSCVALGAECVYQAGDPSTFDAASLAILQRLDALEDLIRENKTNLPGLDQIEEGLSPFSAPKSLRSPTLERTPESAPCYINIESVLAWTVFEDQGIDQRLDLKSLLQADNESADPRPISVAPDFELCKADELLQQFLENVHIFNPILEEAKVKEYMRDAKFNGLGWDAKSCLLLLIYAIGSIAAQYEETSIEISSTFRGSTQLEHGESFFFAAQKRMGMLLCRSGVIEAQCFFLAGVYMMSTLRPIEAWKMFVQALACCQGFYNPSRGHNQLCEEEIQLQESIYWTCFKSELLNVSEKSVWDLTYPEFFPTPPKGLKSKGETVWYFYLSEIALRRLGNRILNYIYRPSVTLESDITDAIPNFEQQADGWLNSLPVALRLNVTNDKSEDYAALRFILNGHLLDCYEMMYWPFVVDAVHGRLHGDVTREFARKGFEVCVKRIQKNESGFYHRHHGTWLMLRSCMRSALVLLGAVRSPELSALLPTEWESAVYKVTAMLRFWKDESREVQDRLDILETLLRNLAPRSLAQ